MRDMAPGPDSILHLAEPVMTEGLPNAPNVELPPVLLEKLRFFLA
jgi:hypothetical protein